MSATASASPITSCAAELLVGARFRGSASRSTLTLRWQVEYFPNSEVGLPLMAMMGICICSTMGINRSSSSVCPEFEMASTTSSLAITPRSPWNTSSGLMKNDGVPVDDSVAAIFAPMWPLFPTPVTITFPLQLYIMSTARSKFSSILGIKSMSACASSLMHCTPYSLAVIIYFSSFFMSSFNLFSSNMLAASLSPLSGSGCTSKK